MDKIEKIRQEIERHRQAIRVLNEHTAPEQTSKTCAIFQYSDTILSDLLSFLDTLSEAPNKSLEEAAEKYRRESYRKSVMPNTDGPIPEYGGNVKDAFIAGAEWQKSQMMKEAVEGYVNYYEDSGGILMAEAQVGCPYHNGDKVKIIIVKEENK